MRKEHDSLGEIQIPDEAWYGPHTARSRQNFDAAGEDLPLVLIRAMVRLKQACARANVDLDSLDPKIASAIDSAAARVLAGEFDCEFHIDVFQAGSGTSSNMNVNEVLANIAAVAIGGKRGGRDRVHPNDHVNMGQSTNNVFPSAMRLVVVERGAHLTEAANALAQSLHRKGDEFAEVIKSGRTHLQDAVPVTVGQEFHAWAHALEKSISRIDASRERCRELGIGGNAVGTSLNNPKEFRQAIIVELNQLTGESYRVADNGIEITHSLTDLADAAGSIKWLATDLHQLANNLRLLASGPRTGLGELTLPAVEPGSSIMPGKINPSICEATNMACLQIMGLCHAVELAASAGQLELNTHMPLVGTNLAHMIDIMARTCRMLEQRCITGIEANVETCRKHFESSAGLPTVLNPLLGYDKVAQLVKESLKTGKNLTQLVREKNLLSEHELQQLLQQSTGPLPDSTIT